MLLLRGLQNRNIRRRQACSTAPWQTIERLAYSRGMKEAEDGAAHAGRNPLAIYRRAVPPCLDVRVAATKARSSLQESVRRPYAVDVHAWWNNMSRPEHVHEPSTGVGGRTWRVPDWSSIASGSSSLSPPRIIRLGPHHPGPRPGGVEKKAGMPSLGAVAKVGNV
jgi:hypothetical protein